MLWTESIKTEHQNLQQGLLNRPEANGNYQHSLDSFCGEVYVGHCFLIGNVERDELCEYFLCGGNISCTQME